MDEESVSKATRKMLKDRGYFVFKHSDTSTTGVPDMTITGHGKTLWVEDKFMKGQFPLGVLPNGKVPCIKLSAGAREFVNPKRQVQLINLVKLEHHGLAKYWLYIEAEVNEGVTKLLIASLSPKNVFDSYIKKLSMVINMEEVATWRRNFIL